MFVCMAYTRLASCIGRKDSMPLCLLLLLLLLRGMYNPQLERVKAFHRAYPRAYSRRSQVRPSPVFHPPMLVRLHPPISDVRAQPLALATQRTCKPAVSAVECAFPSPPAPAPSSQRPALLLPFGRSAEDRDPAECPVVVERISSVRLFDQCCYRRMVPRKCG